MVNSELNVSLSLMVEQWSQVKEALHSGKVDAMDTEKLISDYMFFKQFDDMFRQAVQHFEIPLETIQPMYRGANGKVDLDNYERMIPKLEFAKGHNRMNPPNTAFIYLGVLGENRGRTKDVVKKHITKTLLQEIRASRDSMATICEFQVSDKGKGKKIVSVCGDDSIPLSERQIVAHIRNQISKNRNKESIEQVISRVLTSVYFNIFSSDKIFKPVETDQQEVKKYEYSPFHALASYILKQGYAGIQFKSTVHRSGTNLVLFETDDVSAVENSMEHVQASEFI
ncbi:RES family NAD+ phosphorylase [Priestia aryabhattai]|uniref:RES family NAD+ phosphorylase n=1 Tax=Priestia aryabhattai TaxID=412384 RepID=UPI003CBFC2AA